MGRSETRGGCGTLGPCKESNTKLADGEWLYRRERLQATRTLRLGKAMRTAQAPASPTTLPVLPAERCQVSCLPLSLVLDCQLTCAFLRCFEVTLPNPLGIAGWTPDGSCTCCIARARKCTPGTESRNPSTYFGETLDADFLANSPDFVTKVSQHLCVDGRANTGKLTLYTNMQLKRNHFLAESSEDGVPNRATVRGRDCAPLTQEESDHVSALLLQILQQSDRQFRRSFFNVLEAAFPVDTDNDGQ